jgi:hypothetical protein
MRLKFPSLAVGSLIGLFFVCPQAIRAQDADPAADQAEVEDATLDGSGAEAAAAAAAVPTPKSTPEPAPESTSEATGPAASEQQSAGQESTEQEAQSQVVETPVPATPTAEIAEPAKAAPVELESSVTVGTYGGRVFGQRKVQLAANRPVWNESQKCYDKIYGKPETYGSISGEWFPMDWWVNPGVMMRMGMYTVRGKAVSGVTDKNNINCDTLTVDDESKTTLLFIPLQIGPKIQFSPFRKKWLVADFWMAAEYDWFQETRDADTAMIRPLSPMATDRVYTNTGRKSAVSTGVSAHILLNSLEERTVRSMVETMGIGYVYLTGFMETVKTTSTEGLTFGRNVMGIGFTFESVK